jgi:flavin-dependent dehydrogenase
MKKYEVIIIGSGVAGSGLAYNLKRMGFKGKVLVLDKNKTNPETSYRITFKDTAKKYKIPYERKYSYLKFYFSEKGLIDFKIDSYLVNYPKFCSYLLDNSGAEYKNEKAIDVRGNLLKTNKNSYEFKYLIDCSGCLFFVKNLEKMSVSHKYWRGYSEIFKTTRNLDKDSFYYFFHEDGSFEDIYPSEKESMYGYWRYADVKNSIKIKIPKKSFALKMIGNRELIGRFSNKVSCSPALPLVYKNIAFLGDSFGNATTSSAEGIKPTLDTSEILANAIKMQDLEFYEKTWKKRYLNSYVKFLAFRMIRYPESALLKKIKEKFLPANIAIFDYLEKNPKIFFKILRNDDSFKRPEEFKKCFSKLNVFLLLLMYLKLKMQYAMM